jgi:hypothetical protein
MMSYGGGIAKVCRGVKITAAAPTGERIVF